MGVGVEVGVGVVVVGVVVGSVVVGLSVEPPPQCPSIVSPVHRAIGRVSAKTRAQGCIVGCTTCGTIVGYGQR